MITVSVQAVFKMRCTQDYDVIHLKDTNVLYAKQSYLPSRATQDISYRKLKMKTVLHSIQNKSYTV